MDIEELNKQQTILLATLVSFVTSIATGIVTVSLLEESPVSINRSVNRVVERTVERVVPSDNNNPKVIEKEKTVVVKEEDQITKSIQQGADSLVKVYAEKPSYDNATFLGLGVVVRDSGLIATDSAVASSASSLYGVTADGVTYQLEVSSSREGISLLQAKAEEEDGKVMLKSLKMAGASNLQLGKTVLAVGGQERNSVSMGIISEIVPESTSGNATSSEQGDAAVAEIRTNLDTTQLVAGTPLLNIFGEVVAITVRTEEGVRFITTNQISEEMSSISAATSTNSGS